MPTERRIQSTPDLRIERRADASGQTPYLVGYASVLLALAERSR